MSADSTPEPPPSTAANSAAGRPAATPPLARALGRVPSGLFIVATTLQDRPIGFVASFVQQVGFAPPTVMVAIGQDRDHLRGVRASGRFTVSVLGEADRALMKPFFKAPPTGTAFDLVETAATERGGLVLSGALAWLDCKLSGEHAVGDHVVIFGHVEDGSCAKDGEPLVHVRKNGLGY